MTDSQLIDEIQRLAAELTDKVAALRGAATPAPRLSAVGAAVRLTPDEWRELAWPPQPELVDLTDRDTWITLQKAMGDWGVSETTARERCKTRPIAVKPYGVWLINRHRAMTRRGTLPGEKRGN